MKKKILIYLGVTIGVLHFIVLNSGYFNYAISQTSLTSPVCNISKSIKAGYTADGGDEVVCVSCSWISYVAHTNSDGSIRFEAKGNEASIFMEKATCVKASSNTSCTVNVITSTSCPESETAPPDSGSGSGTGTGS